MSIEDLIYPLKSAYERSPNFVKEIAGLIYRRVPVSWRYGKELERFRSEAMASEQWGEKEMADYQLRELRETLRAAWKAPFYKRHFLEHGLKENAELECLEQLREYPLISKADVISHREEMVNSELGKASGLYNSTGGSSGEPMGFYLHAGVSRSKEQAYLEAQWRRKGYSSGDKTAVLRGHDVSPMERGAISYYDASRNWLVMSSSHLSQARIHEFVEALNHFKPRHLHAYPSSALMLARGMQAEGLAFDFKLTSLLCGSEKLMAEDQQFLEDFYQAPVNHWYGHSERVVLAGQGVEPGAYHQYFWPGYGFVEWGEADDEGRREVIGTSFHNQVMPMVRYRTGDYVQLPVQARREFCWPEIQSVSGRDYEFLISASGRRVSLTTVNMHDRTFEGLLAVQFEQATAGRVICQVQPSSAWSESRLGVIQSRLESRLGEGFAVQVIPVAKMKTTGRGKHRWLISALSSSIDSNPS